MGRHPIKAPDGKETPTNFVRRDRCMQGPPLHVPIPRYLLPPSPRGPGKIARSSLPGISFQHSLPNIFSQTPLFSDVPHFNPKLSLSIFGNQRRGCWGNLIQIYSNEGKLSWKEAEIVLIGELGNVG